MGKPKKKRKRGRPRKKPHQKVGVIYWEGVTIGTRRRYTLAQVTTAKGGVSLLSQPLTKREADVFVQAWNKAKGKRGRKIRAPRR